MRYALSFLLASLLSLAAQAQTPKEGGVAPPIDTERFTTRLTVSPMAAPRPAMRYELLPPLRERTPGNAAVGYLRAAVLRPSWPKDPKESLALSEKWEKWEITPVDQLPLEAIKKFLVGYQPMLYEADEAARLDRCDWQFANRKWTDMQNLLPAVQTHRELMRILSLRVRTEIAEKRFDAAIRTLQTSFQLGRQVGEGSTMIEMLVGYAIIGISIGRCDEFIGQPNAPNLYWALATLPNPIFDPRPALDGESRFHGCILPILKELERGPVSEDVAAKAFREVYASIGMAQDPDDKLGEFAKSVALAGMVAMQSTGAKKDLIARGMAKATVDAMPTTQAVLLRSLYLHRDLWDDQVKQFFMPYPLASKEMERIAVRTMELRKSNTNDPLFAVFSLVYPALLKVHVAHSRVARQIAQLRAIEAVRMHVASTGLIPKSLADVTIVPVPDDPTTGKPFAYETNDGTFTLGTTAASATGSIPKIYVVTLRK